MTRFWHEIDHGWLGYAFIFGGSFLAMWVAMLRGSFSFRVFKATPLAVLIVVIVVGLIEDFLVDPLTQHPGTFRDAVEFCTGLPLCLLASYGFGIVLGTPDRDAKPRYRRGAIVGDADPDPVPRRRRFLFFRRRPTPPRSNSLTLAGLPLSLLDETKHFKIMGSTGTGKSTAIRELLRAALDRGDRAIIADPDGGCLDIFYDASRGDVILNPFEPDALKWDLFGEITRVYDIEQIARALIPDLGGEERVWSEYARTFFGAVTQQLIRAGTRDDKTLHRLIRSADEDELRELLAGTAAGPFLRQSSDRMFGSLRSVASAAVRVLEHTVEQPARPFSVRQWVREGAARQAGGKGGVLFLPYRASQIASLRAVISAWMRLGIFEAMDRPAGDQRLWFIVDELDALGTIDGLKDALARLRKFGGRCVLGFQSIAQVSGTYGREVADTLVENCGNTLILRCSASERGGTSEFASKLIGQREMLHTTQSKTRRRDEESTTNSQQIRIEPAVMASEIERLPDLSGFLKIASRPDWQRVSLTPVHYPTVIRDSRAAAATPSSASDPSVVSGNAATLIPPVAGPLGGAESAS